MVARMTFVLLTGAAMITSGCATITRGKSETVQFVSTPSGAAVTTTMGTYCTTPCSMEIPRKQAFNAIFRSGSETRTVKVATKVHGEGLAVGAGNVLVGGIVGVAVDATSGATLNHVPNPVFADFSRPQSQAQAVAEAYAAEQKKKKASEEG